MVLGFEIYIWSFVIQCCIWFPLLLLSADLKLIVRYQVDKVDLLVIVQLYLDKSCAVFESQSSWRHTDCKVISIRKLVTYIKNIFLHPPLADLKCFAIFRQKHMHLLFLIVVSRPTPPSPSCTLFGSAFWDTNLLGMKWPAGSLHIDYIVLWVNPPATGITIICSN